MIAALAYREPRFAALALLVIVSAGLSALLALGRQEDPTITNLFATVTTPFPGADAARVEALVTVPVETALREIPEIDTVESASAAGVSVVQIDLVETIAPDRIEGIWSEVRDALAELRPDFPVGVQAPELEADGAGAYGAIVSLRAASPDTPPGVVLRHAEALADRLRGVPGTSLVDLFGAPEEEVLVTLDPQRTAALGLTADAVSDAIRAADSKGQAGRLRGDGAEMILSVAGEIAATERVRAVILREGPEGALTRVADIAAVTRGVRTPPAEAALHDGAPAILVAAKLVERLQVDVWMGQVRAALADFRAGAPDGLEATLIFDQSRYTAERLRDVGANMALGVALVVGVLLLTLGLRAAMIVAVILPVVSLASLATMNLIGLAIHQMSVTGLIVALGLLVDAGIVMTDEIGQRLRAGMARAAAVGEAVRRLFMPLMASTVTTALSFMPMALLPGPAGDFVGSIAIAVIVMLLWSFVVAVTLTPALAGWAMPAREGRGVLGSGLRLPRLGRTFRASLLLALANPVRAVALSLAPPVLGFAAMPLLTPQFFPGVDRDQFTLEIDLRVGAPLAATRAVVERLDAVLRETPEVRSVAWVLGRSAPAFYYNVTGGRRDAPRHAQALVTTLSPQATEALIRRLEREAGALAPESQVLVRGLVQGPPVAAPVELRLVGPDVATLRELGAEVRRVAATVPSVVLARETLVAGGAELSVTLDEAAARTLGLTPGAVARQLEASLEGVTGGSLIEGTEELPVRVRVGDAVRGDLQAIVDLPIVPPTGPDLAGAGGFAATPLSALAQVGLAPASPVITRRNGERANAVQAFTLRDMLPEAALAEVRAALDATGFALPRGYRLEIGGDSDARASTLGNLLASLGLIVTLSIAAIVATFRSFRLSVVAIVVSALSAGLSLLSLAVFDYPFGINAIIGVIGSIGVSINAAIIILTGLQEDPAARGGDRAAMADVVMGSSRHIVSTTVTTFGGFLPLILAGGGFWPPFAMSVAGGVLLSTVVSFYATPPLFALVYARRRPPVALATRRPILVAAQ